jgi:hypothetical protein
VAAHRRKIGVSGSEAHQSKARTAGRSDCGSFFRDQNQQQRYPERMPSRLYNLEVALDDKIARALDINVRSIARKVQLPDGICEEAVGLLKDKMCALQSCDNPQDISERLIDDSWRRRARL